ncbi:MAG TPA: tetraacyldisaccharide 4'-kinase [Thermoanaerobaculia bacterium]|nr:tetraacyldisaccharide 4'-kinase [Thermoanaerobaculia bacterium]
MTPLLLPLSGLYGAGVALRLALYRRGLLAVRAAARPVVSVGNVAAGGTGKTPFVRWLAGELLRRGRHPSILTRGYGRGSRGTVVVSDGRGAFATVADSGDEPALLARALPSVPIVADARRRDAAARAETLGTPVDLHLLDDGFSHVALARDVDVVLLDATAPDAGGALLPAGRLREPLSSLARADLLVVTKTEQSDPGPALEIARRFAPGVPVYRARTEVLGVTGRDGLPVEPGDLPPGTAVAVAGIARPEAFGATLASIGIEPVELLSFRDHEPYGPASLGRIERALEESGATAVVTTEKDAVKLDERLRVPVFRVAVEARPVEPTFVADLLSLLARRPS